MSAGETVPSLDADRLAKLWEAYRAQEEELQNALAHVDRLTQELEGRGQTVAERERVLAEKDAEIARLTDLLDEKDRRIVRLQALEEDVKAIQAYKDRVAELEAAYAQEKERLAKLFLLYEEATKGA
jgi:DNA repair exonuclease SbcCD ATPase subunit